MTDFLIQATLSNLIVSTVLACVAWLVQRRIRCASLANLLWALVLVKMLTPPLFSLPVLEVPTFEVNRISVSSVETTGGMDSQWNEAGDEIGEGTVLNGTLPNMEVSPELENDKSPTQSPTLIALKKVTPFAIGFWAITTATLFVISIFRIARFHLLLKANCSHDLELTDKLSAQVAAQIGLKRAPLVYQTKANIAPFVWWMYGRPAVVISSNAIENLSSQDLQLVVAHEVAHIHRRDHWFRWAEWAVLIFQWWNPVMWLARHQLRISEEIACDELVVEKTKTDKHQYATSLLNMAELLATTSFRPPVVASAINSGGELEKRLTMMITDKTRSVPYSLRIAILAVAACIFPLGIVCAQDFKAVERRLGEAVAAGELSINQAKNMMDVLKKSVKEKSANQVYDRNRGHLGIVPESSSSKNESEKENLIKIQNKLIGEIEKKQKDIDRYMIEKKRRYSDIKKKIEMAVKAGDLSKRDAETKLAEVENELFDERNKPTDREFMKESLRDKRATDGEKFLRKVQEENVRIVREKIKNQLMEEKKRRYAEIMRKIEQAVKAGDLSKRDAEKKLIEIRREMFGDTEQNRLRMEKERNNEEKKRRYIELTKEIELAVKSGDLSKRDAERKLIEIRQAMFNEVMSDQDRANMKRDRNMEIKKRQYSNLMQEIERAVKAGDLSKADAERKLKAVRNELFGQEKGSDDRGQEQKKKMYKAIVSDVELAVKAGDLSKKDAEKKLYSIRIELFGDSKEKSAKADDVKKKTKPKKEKSSNRKKDKSKEVIEFAMGLSKSDQS